MNNKELLQKAKEIVRKEPDVDLGLIKIIDIVVRECESRCADKEVKEPEMVG